MRSRKNVGDGDAAGAFRTDPTVVLVGWLKNLLDGEMRLWMYCLLRLHHKHIKDLTPLLLSLTDGWWSRVDVLQLIRLLYSLFFLIKVNHLSS